jgi:hypothetical protein
MDEALIKPMQQPEAHALCIWFRAAEPYPKAMNRGHG